MSITTPPPLPAAAVELLALAERIGWKTSAEHGVDSGGSPFVTIDVGARRGDEAWHYRITWHTRGTGTYRLFSKLARTHAHYWRDAPSLRAIRAAMEHVGKV